MSNSLFDDLSALRVPQKAEVLGALSASSNPLPENLLSDKAVYTDFLKTRYKTRYLEDAERDLLQEIEPKLSSSHPIKGYAARRMRALVVDVEVAIKGIGDERRPSPSTLAALQRRKALDEKEILWEAQRKERAAEKQPVPENVRGKTILCPMKLKP